MRIAIQILVAMVIVHLSLPASSQSMVGTEHDPIYRQTFEKVDKDLNRVYHEVLTAIKDGDSSVNRSPDSIGAARFRDAEVAWVRYKDAQILALWPLMNNDNAKQIYGSMLPMCALITKTALERIRIAELKLWLQEVTGEISGDPCNSEIFEGISKKLILSKNREP
ncbi:MAG: lysozyme inhibitor LprI family protein [Bacteroidota bacterium]|nr:lysozyme inhibitor LprI family protein [Bacteroidota bacterium]MDP4233971.1 lysozyme inhibitor LprI family protein [Bacteroidota bacterium]MDP4242778.1 lysozyme inhibitor LprI family protein [Bacteroidota bacterium]MDP4288492.1 lysozyme inhibitor LprI family protein [Bacteroidota bacterium]